MSDSNDDDPLASWLAEAGSKRQYERLQLSFPASLMASGKRHKGTIRDVSPLGGLLWLGAGVDFEVGANVILMPTGYRTVRAEVRRVMDDGHLLGLKLLHEPEEQAELARWLNTLRAPSRR